MKRFALLAAGVAVLLAAAALADEPPTRLLVLSRDPALLHAVSSALGPWGVSVVPSDANQLGASMPIAASDAHALALREHVDGVAWVSTSEGGAALWTYDVHTDQVVTRPLAAAPPYDEMHAASVALSLKTMLRSTEVAPEPERIVHATPMASATPAPPSSIVGALPLPPKARPDAVPRPTTWLGELAVGARFAGSSNAIAEPRLGLLFARQFGRWAVGVSGSFGLGTSARATDYSLRLTSTTVGTLVRFNIVDGPVIRAGLGARLELDVLDLAGDVGAQRLTVSDTRVDVAIGAEAFGLLRLTPTFGIGLSAAVRTLLLRQEFFVAEVRAVSVYVAPIDGLVFARVAF